MGIVECGAVVSDLVSAVGKAGSISHIATCGIELVHDRKVDMAASRGGTTVAHGADMGTFRYKAGEVLIGTEMAIKGIYIFSTKRVLEYHEFAVG